MEKVTEQNFKSIIYISHPYGGAQENEHKIASIINELIKQYPNHLFVSPVHAFSYAYTTTDYDKGISWCLWLLEKCDEMWVYGDYKNSRGCSMEIEYCKEHQIVYKIMR